MNEILDNIIKNNLNLNLIVNYQFSIVNLPLCPSSSAITSLIEELPVDYNGKLLDLNPYIAPLNTFFDKLEVECVRECKYFCNY